MSGDLRADGSKLGRTLKSFPAHTSYSINYRRLHGTGGWTCHLTEMEPSGLPLLTSLHQLVKLASVNVPIRFVRINDTL